MPRNAAPPIKASATPAKSAAKASGSRARANSTAGLRGPAPRKAAASSASARGLNLLTSPLGAYYLLVGSVALLALIGLVMSLSSSSVRSITAGLSPYAQLVAQLRHIGMGAALMALMVFTPIKWIKRLAGPVFVVACALQVLTFIPAFSLSAGGNNSWIYLPVVGVMQPAEAGKLALVVWLGAVLGKRHGELGYWRAASVPALGTAAMILLVLGGDDLGTALVFFLMVLCAFVIAGTPMKLIGVAGGAAVTAVAYFLIFSQDGSNRLNRILATFDPNCDTAGICYQALHGRYALATGGLFGVGLGSSRQKWNYLPEAHNDFVFAIIGEELGLLGTLLVLGLFVCVGLAMARVITTSNDPFVRVATAGVGGWILGQAFINIGVVIGLLPVIGLPLPFVSAGGSALLTTMGAMGLVINFARHAPGVGVERANRALLARQSLTVVAR